MKHVNTYINSSACLILCALATACGDPAPFGTVDDTMSDEALVNHQPVARYGAELSANGTEECELAPADKTISGSFEGSNAFTTGRTYGSGQCYHGHILDVNDYSDPSGVAGNYYWAGNGIVFADSKPANKQDCENSLVRTYVWRINANNSKTFIGNKTRKGKWERDVGICDPNVPNDPCLGPYVCKLGSISLSTHFSLQEGQNYRFGTTARTNGARKKIRFENIRVRLPN